MQEINDHLAGIFLQYLNPLGSFSVQWYFLLGFCDLLKRLLEQKKKRYNAMASSNYIYEEEETKAGGREMQCVKTTVGISTATYFVLSFSCPSDLSQPGNLRLESVGWVTIKPERHWFCILCVYFRCAKSQTFWGYIRTLFPLSPLRLIFTHGSLF